MQKNHVVIASISPLDGNPRTIQRSYGRFSLQPCPKDQPFVLLVIEDQTDEKVLNHSMTEREFAPFNVPAELVAQDILRTEDLEREGAFLCEGEQPTAAELSKAHTRRTAWLTQCVREGDALYGRFGNRALDQIPDYCKRAVEELGEHKDWVFQLAAPKMQCPGCGDMVGLLRDGSKPAVCKGCGAILDAEKAKSLGMVKDVEAPEPVEVGAERKPRAKTARD